MKFLIIFFSFYWFTGFSQTKPDTLKFLAIEYRIKTVIENNTDNCPTKEMIQEYDKYVKILGCKPKQIKGLQKCREIYK